MDFKWIWMTSYAQTVYYYLSILMIVSGLHRSRIRWSVSTVIAYNKRHTSNLHQDWWLFRDDTVPFTYIHRIVLHGISMMFSNTVLINTLCCIRTFHVMFTEELRYKNVSQHEMTKISVVISDSTVCTFLLYLCVESETLGSSFKRWAL